MGVGSAGLCFFQTKTTTEGTIPPWGGSEGGREGLPTAHSTVGWCSLGGTPIDSYGLTFARPHALLVGVLGGATWAAEQAFRRGLRTDPHCWLYGGWGVLGTPFHYFWDGEPQKTGFETIWEG